MDQGMLAWQKSSYSGTDDNCVEVAHLPLGDLAIRDNKNPTRPILRFAADEWRTFISGMKVDRFTQPAPGMGMASKRNIADDSKFL
ncbi:DUF397 domain-containing protein [Sphaerisporangium rhizosphaerae]|uniref:DUF397 domain-containing protein n=1 Tax=Sphaerisporangium rhizosphaerae TaxID=2269375 RepID=A0ABW2P930_9ACTN